MTRQLPLFPAQPPAAPLPVLDERLRGTAFFALAAKTILNAPERTGAGFWSLNPYVGCEFGCTYCYARYAHRYVVGRIRDAGRLADAELARWRGPHGWEAFERRVFVKQELRAALEADLARHARAPAAADGDPLPIVIGTATDPYQPAERRFRLTRQALERLARCEGLNIGIITKSPLVTRDLDVLRRLQERNDLAVHISLISLDPALLRRVEARSPLPHARLRALGRLAASGINAGLLIAPVLPGISDGARALDALFRAARDAGARFVHAGPLRLYAGVRDHFLPVLDAAFPHLAARYRRAYAGRYDAPRAYAAALARRVARLQRAYGFPIHPDMAGRDAPRRPALQARLPL
jgi:DNA repair photolyase